jgi:helicase
MFAPGFNPSIREFEICMKNGIRRELLPLVKLRGIGRVRARRLFNNSITSPEAVLSAGIETVTRIIGRGIAEQIFAQLEESRNPTTTPAAGEDNIAGQSTLSRFR